MNKTKLGKILDVRRGTSLSGEYYSTKGDKIRLTLGNFNYPSMGFKENTSKTDIYFTGKVRPEFILKKGDIITPLTEQAAGLLGETARIPEDNIYIQSGDIGLVIPNEKFLDKSFTYYLISSPLVKKQLGAAAQQTKIRHTSPDKIKDCEIFLLDIENQKRVGFLLDTINSKIDLNNKINRELEAMAKTLYDYWFVQLDFPDINGKPYKSSGGKMVYSKELNMEVPEGWEVKALNKCVELIIDHRGKTPAKLGGNWSNDKNDIIALSARIVKGGKLINLDKANKVSKDLYDKWMAKKLQNGDILMTSEAPAGEFYFIHDFTEYCLSQRLFAIRANQNLLIPSYFYYELSKGHGYSQIQGSLSGSTVFGIRQDVLRRIKIIVPNLKIQERFNNIILPQLRQIKQLDKQNQELASLRDWLLPMLMNGQVEVADSPAEGKVYQMNDAVSMAAEPER